jgi:multiple sugar transport system permease protein
MAISEAVQAQPAVTGATSTAARRMTAGDRDRPSSLVASVLLAVIGLIFVWPAIWVFTAAITQNPGYQVSWPTWTLLNFRAVIDGGYLHSLVNSAILGGVSALVAVLPAIPASYALARRRVPLRRGLMIAILFLTAVPIGIVVIPLFEVFAAHNLLSIVPTGLFLGATNLPFAIWLITNGMQAIPVEIEEAAIAESASVWQRITRILIPLSMPSIVSAAFLSFINGWGSFLIPLVLISAPAQQPGPLALYDFVHVGTTQYGEIAAFSILFSLPVVLLYVVMSRVVSGGFALAGSIHG